MYPVILLFLLTLSWFDVRKNGKRNLFLVTYAISILWIFAFGYLLVWWSTVFGQTVALPATITGLLILGMFSHKIFGNKHFKQKFCQLI